MDLESSDSIKWRVNMDNLTRDYYDVMRDLNPKDKFHGKVIAFYGGISSMGLEKEKYLDVFPNFSLERDFKFIKDAGHMAFDNPMHTGIILEQI
jgi:hypothetical protein